MVTKPHIVVLGAGPTGLGAACQLTCKKIASVSVIEESEKVGGNAASFEIAGLQADYGSHRLHSTCDPQILNDIRMLLGDDLVDRPRHGRIRLHGRWVHFPLEPLDLAFQLPLSFPVRVATDLIAKILRTKHGPSGAESFASVLEAGLGTTICQEFYFPYARKVWGYPAEEISVKQVHRRVSANSMTKMFQKILSAVPGINPNSGGRFFYPRRGFGQISQCLYHEAMSAGAEFYLNSRVDSIRRKGHIVNTIHCAHGGQVVPHRADYVWSTIPISSLVECFQPPAPLAVTQASENIQYRAMILVYLVLEQDRFSEFDAHYFPTLDIPITRISEPKNYSTVQEPKNRTVLCAELPCSTTDPEWSMSDHRLGKLVYNSLESAGIPVKAPLLEVVARRLDHAYPIYRQGYEKYFNRIDQWLNQIENLLTFGRQGLFVHDNTHHALFMAYAAVKCLNKDGLFDTACWQEFRRVFDTHVVED